MHYLLLNIFDIIPLCMILIFQTPMNVIAIMVGVAIPVQIQREASSARAQQDQRCWRTASHAQQVSLSVKLNKMMHTHN